MKTDIYIVGVGMTPFGHHANNSVGSLARAAMTNALSDAAVEQNTVQSIYFSNSTQGHMEGQDTIRGQVALIPRSYAGTPIYNVEAACAGGSIAFHLAARHLRAGDGDLVAAVGAEKMISDDRKKMFSVFDGGWDVSKAQEILHRFRSIGMSIEGASSHSEMPYSAIMEVYAAMCRDRMERFGVTQQQLATVAAKNRKNASLNPIAHFQKAYSIEEILASRLIVFPLTLLMCSPISDGAAAILLTTEQGLTKYGIDRRRAVRVMASVVQSGGERAPDDFHHQVTCNTAREAYELAALDPDDMDLAEVHDAAAMGEIIQSENLGFCPIGEGGDLALSGATGPSGRIPVNPSGGLEGRGHPIGATGLAQIHEIVTQLRGEAGKRQVENARHAIQENGGGIYGLEEAVAHVGIYRAPNT
ncbi:thiolase family protein [Emcibacter nanhaiensis]|uniref:Thiolase family protein n=1 Tax=Emcibacter nanhaiensis TaxID=1505037 RepID=A0A501PGY6_9PROT|nr:thiolase family protein [Emcibacter nanhaiensis]TPD59261.1 thiolase family protein [Emcibacter nanhaiensis]